MSSPSPPTPTEALIRPRDRRTIAALVAGTLALMAAGWWRHGRDGGTIVVINHFRSEIPVIAGLQRSIDPVTRRLGWTTLRLGELLRLQGLAVNRVWKTSARSLFTIVEARNQKSAGRDLEEPRRDAGTRSAAY